MKKLFTFTLFFVLNLFIINKVFAATAEIVPSKDYVGISEQFYVDVMLNLQENESINGVLGQLSFPDNNVTFLRAEEGKSIINLWVEKPKVEKNVVNFAGVISSGFNGVIDPFNPNKKLPGMVVRLVFEPTYPGPVNFSTGALTLNLNDGMGTEIIAQPTNGIVNVGNFSNKTAYKNINDNDPEIEAYVTRDPNIFNNKYFLVFNATDKETGIKDVKIKEGRRDWKEIKSPYLLADQSRHSVISLQATNFSGAGISMSIDKVPYDWKYLAKISIVAIIVIGLLIWFIRKIYVSHKN